MQTVASSSARPTELSALVERATAGDASAEAALVTRFAPAARIFARRRLRDREAVDELVQDAMLLLVEALRDGRVVEPERVGGFVLGICRNLARERARVRDRRRELWERFGPAVAEHAESRPVLDRVHLEDCLSSLTHRARRVLQGAFVEERTNPEIAVQLGLSAGNVRVIRHRSLAALKECMEGPDPREFFR